jgi:hypothetical protein
MSAFHYKKAFRCGVATMFELLTQEQMRQLAHLPADLEIADRLVELGGKANEGELSPSERAEYEGYIEANNLLTVLQVEARLRLLNASGAERN